MSSQVFITGATGFVGKQVLRILSERSIKARVVIRDAKLAKSELLSEAAEIVISKDLFSESPQWWSEQLQGIDVIVHLAWYVEPGQYLQSPKNMDCLVGSLKLAQGAIQAGVKRFVGVGTCFEYDLSGGVLSIDTPLKPITPYASAKAALFLSLTHLLQTHRVEFAWCRLFYLYGEGEDPRRLVPYLRSQLENGEIAKLTSGEQVRDFIDVADAGRIIAGVCLNNQIGPINVCSGTPITVQQFAEQIADEYERRDLLVFGARPSNLVDPAYIVGVPNSCAEKLNT